MQKKINLTNVAELLKGFHKLLLQRFPYRQGLWSFYKVSMRPKSTPKETELSRIKRKGLTRINNWLTERKQRTKINGHFSQGEQLPVESQRTLLRSVLLFVMKDLEKVVNNK